MDRETLANHIFAVAHLTGEFTLRSGATSTEYFDKYLFESDPLLLEAIAESMAPLVPDDTQVLAGLELGGVPLAVALSRATGIPTAFVRKEAKAYGTA
ncbi:MAG: orotate phosphoribosyltransferase, partial [Actinobacteria bacterium]|nr:orotate phosphoribosyltransferase [Actinomycetota bacterium]